ncbi:BTAD domain-containing putative transcriptional regulator [Amycolatopsis sp. EV170708-02-1]|uniref:BTAD domain-containing putative transcriptional regulator n=1 Tax=Amycolatopsis sp. EV170708-02-1 TaxID=2919322 RepID=UPI001F0C20C2|nr:BTAD domain-containing putative transcriptional regulator [Amycolatopsis sp. EV170708-02-1]UMO99944.1 winged helix-turn-helix domain-containing protein [Amycolatopsis sp. EV170708-02-1]
MRFGVLGPLEVWTADGTPVTIRESKVRALLADLLANDGRLVTADRLIADLWGDALPGNPANTLQTRVWQLRRALAEAEPGGRELVVSRRPGYLLRVGPEALDMHRFQALLAHARTVRDPAARAAVLSEALGLWRGRAFAGFEDTDFARPLAQRLEEQRLYAIEEQAEARLDADDRDGAAVASELGDLVAAHPLRERLRAAQMRALYLAGRQSEALAGYHILRRQLADELGVDPSPELADLHQAILAQAPTLGPAAAPAANLTRPRTNLPAPLTPLIGRAEALPTVRSMLDSGRLVTLTGPGGVGKTRLAVETARQLADAFPDGTWLVELSALDRAEDGDPGTAVVDLVARVLDLRDDTPAGPLPTGGRVPLIERLTASLRTRRSLLVLDNCEHVVDAVADLAGRLLAAAPGLHILATSREPLAIEGELLQPVPPLELPEPGTPPSVLRRSSAVELFVARASAAAPGFELNAGNADAVAVVCRHLDGIPLAIELAATRVRALDVRELATRLNDRFRLLTGGRRGGPARHRTLEAMIDWSWQLLTQAERIVLRRLAVHAGSCSLAAAETLCAGDGVRPDDVLDLLARLVDRSLVVVVDTPSGARYRLLESIAAYCRERLEEAGETARMRRGHARHYTELAEQAEPHLRGGAQRQWLASLDAETANLRRALDSLVDDGDVALGLRLVGALGWYWFLRGRLGEARRAFELVLGLDSDSDRGAAGAVAQVWHAGISLMIRDTGTPAPVPEEMRRLCGGIDDPVTRARMEWFLGFAQAGFGAPAASEGLADRSLSAFRATEDRWGIAAVSTTRAALALARGDLGVAERLGAESLAVFDELGDDWGHLKAGQVLAVLAEIIGDYGSAARLHRDGLRTAEELGLRTEAAWELSGLGRIALLDGDYAAADHWHHRSMRLAIEQSHHRGIQYAEVGLGLGARRQGRLDAAEKHLRNWLDWCRRWDGDAGVALILAELGFIAEQRGDTAKALALHLDGFRAARSTADPRAIALALEGLAGAEALAGRHGHAAHLLGMAAVLRRSAGAPLPPAERGDVERITAAIRQALGERDFAAAFEHGNKTTLENL